MNLKKSWNKRFGKSEIVTAENSTCKKVEMDMLRLAAGSAKKYREENKEYALVILGGACTVAGEGFAFENVGKRATVFDGAATCVYVPANVPFSVTAVTEVQIAVCKSPSTRVCKPAIINPEDVVIKNLGKPGWEREAHFILDDRTDAEMLYIGEAFVKGGQWASYPPHKHHVDNMPTEGFLDEIYYFEFDKPQGFGFQAVYSKEGDINEVYKVKTGDLVEVPKGYHPFTVAPGYKNYCLWIMAGKNRGIFCTAEEEHKWVNN